jgi:hypothetical protein
MTFGGEVTNRTPRRPLARDEIHSPDIGMAKGLKIGLVKAFATTEGTPLRPALSVLAGPSIFPEKTHNHPQYSKRCSRRIDLNDLVRGVGRH